MPAVPSTTSCRAAGSFLALSLETIGVNDNFANKIVLFDFELVSYQGEAVHGIVPEYADMERMEAYLLAERKGTLGEGFDTATYEADVWSFAIIMYELMANRNDLEKIQEKDLHKNPEALLLIH